MYSARITRNNRGAFIVLCDRSGSMAEEVVFEGAPTTKADAVARTINLFVDEVVNRCRREEGVRDYFDIALIEYSGEGVVSLIPRGGGFISTAELAKMPVESRVSHLLRRLPDGNHVSVSVNRREWISPKSFGHTPMGAALAEAGRLAAAWCSRPANRNSFPPVVLNITDGEASDADAVELCCRAENIKNTATADGNTLLVNIHLARRDESEPAISFPCTPDELPSHPYAHLLWEMSSCMPVCCEGAIMESGRSVNASGASAGAVVGIAAGSGLSHFRAMSYNCAVNELFAMLTIGSVSGTVGF